MSLEHLVQCCSQGDSAEHSWQQERAAWERALGPLGNEPEDDGPEPPEWLAFLFWVVMALYVGEALAWWLRKI